MPQTWDRNAQSSHFWAAVTNTEGRMNADGLERFCMCLLCFAQQLQSCWFRLQSMWVSKWGQGEGVSLVCWGAHWIPLNLPSKANPMSWPLFLHGFNVSSGVPTACLTIPTSAVKLQQSSPMNNVENCTEAAAFMQLNDHSFKYPLSSQGLTLFTDQLYSKPQHGLHDCKIGINGIRNRPINSN